MRMMQRHCRCQHWFGCVKGKRHVRCPTQLACPGHGISEWLENFCDARQKTAVKVEHSQKFLQWHDIRWHAKIGWTCEVSGAMPVAVTKFLRNSTWGCAKWHLAGLMCRLLAARVARTFSKCQDAWHGCGWKPKCYPNKWKWTEKSRKDCPLATGKFDQQ